MFAVGKCCDLLYVYVLMGGDAEQGCHAAAFFACLRNLPGLAALRATAAALAEGLKVKWAGMYLLGFFVLLGGLLAALWKLGWLARVGTTWTLIGCAIAIGVGIMFAVSNSGAKENIEINRK